MHSQEDVALHPATPHPHLGSLCPTLYLKQNYLKTNKSDSVTNSPKQKDPFSLCSFSYDYSTGINLVK